jgi:muconolactone delta-isomerase
MKDSYFFGYGSLVNRDTHAYPQVAKAEVRGWRRVWRGTGLRKVAFLTAEPAPDGVIKGLVAAVPRADWAALDVREAAYARHPVQQISHAQGAIDVQIYAVEAAHLDGGHHPILLSYLDTVIQGYLREYGEAGAQEFFETTGGWDMPITHDRDAPIYPRATVLTPQERDFVDENLRRIAA